MDYGHAIEFGTFVTPSAGRPDVPVQLARLSEELGYDVVTFQDHPYQPAFLDTWTLMSYVAAATTTIRIAPNVLNLPMRPAPVTARAAASLDLLSGGRFVLGLGAGGFWDAMTAMGATRLTPGEAVDALSEGIDVIRGIWDTDTRLPLRGGTYYRLDGAKRGPAPAHPIPIWIGALKPRMQRLIGRKGDGWLPSLAYLQPGDLQTGMTRIDRAATDAGRHPGEIRRLLNISGRESVEQLVELALADGVSTFIVASDDPNQLASFAQDVAPAIREAVATERARLGTDVPTGRSSAALAARMPGIAYDDVPDSLRTDAVEPGDFAYRTVRSTYMRGGHPGLVLRPQSIPDVIDAVGFARRHPDVPLGIRSGGHGISGRSTNEGGIIIDVGALNDVEVIDVDRGLVRVGPGATWRQIAAVLAPHGLAITSGDHGGVGVGGLATAGGIGFFSREQGLTIDRMRAVRVVLADGTVIDASADEHPDLFWAVRGAGANVGIAVEFVFEAGRATDLGWVQLTFDASDTADFLQGFGAAMDAAPRDVTLFLILSRGSIDRPTVAYVYGVVNNSDPDTIISRLQPFAAIAPLVNQSVSLATYPDVMGTADDAPHAGEGEPSFRSGFVNALDRTTAERMAALVASGSAPWFQLRAVGGAVADVAADATAYAHRDARFAVTATGRSAQFERLWNELAQGFEGLYLSFDSRTAPELVREAFPANTLERLRDVKRRVDPDGMFRDNFTVAD